MAPSVVLLLVVLAAPHAVAEVFSTKPWLLKYFVDGGYGVEENTLACPEGFSLSCTHLLHSGAIRRHLCRFWCEFYDVNKALL